MGRCVLDPLILCRWYQHNIIYFNFIFNDGLNTDFAVRTASGRCTTDRNINVFWSKQEVIFIKYGINFELASVHEMPLIVLLLSYFFVYF